MAEPWIFDVLPCHPRPYPGECLTGYLVRLADANGGIPVWELVRDLFPRWTGPLQLRLLRWEYPIDDWGRIPLRTQVAPTALDRLTVAPWLEKFRAPLRVIRPGHQSPSSVLRGVVHLPLRVCPLCLQTQPFVRLRWRLAAVQVCLDHGCLLQERCPGCDQPLPAIGPAQRPLCCPRCDVDVRTCPVVPAAETLLRRQQSQQADLQVLLDPAVTLVTPAQCELLGPTLPRAIGHTFRYLRMQAGRTIAEMARQLMICAGTIAELERGDGPTALPLYLAYLDTLGLSWSAFAALEVPAEFLRSQEPPYRALRLCPTPECPNHRPSAGRGVTVAADYRDRQVVRFRCKACHRTFARNHDGTLVTKPRHPPLRPGDQPSVPKSADEITRLKDLGLQGVPNRQIARALGWGEKTVRMYWIALNLEARVHAAQAQRRAEAVDHRRMVLRARVEAIVEALCAAGEEITLRRVSRALGYNADYVGSDPEVATYVETVAQSHNAQVRQRRYEALEARLAAVLEEARHQSDPMTMQQIARQAGLPSNHLHASYPDLHRRIQQAVAADRAARQQARREQRVAQINEIAAELVDQGVRLTYTCLLAATGLDRYSTFRDPVVHDLLEQWIGHPMPPV